MILVEGVDGSGKTTLAHKLAHDLGLQVQVWDMPRAELPNRDVRRRVYQALSDALLGPVYIHDRLFFSELVYGPALREGCEFKPTEENTIRRAFMALSIPVIMCRPSFEVVQANLKAKDHIEGVTENIHDLYERYGDVVPMAANYHNVMFWDFTGGKEGGSYVEYPFMLSVLERYIKTRRERSV